MTDICEQKNMSNPTITTKFMYSDSFPHQRIFKQPLFLLGWVRC